jgi:hypothetical protein
MARLDELGRAFDEGAAPWDPFGNNSLAGLAQRYDTLGNLSDDPFERAALRTRQAERPLLGRQGENTVGKMIDFMIPKTPLDVATYALGGPFSVPVKIGALVAGGLLTPSDTEAAPVSKIGKAVTPGIGHNSARMGITSSNLRELPYDEALAIARSQVHVIPKPEGGGFVGAPYSIKNQADLARTRADFDRQVEEGLAGAPWYRKAQAGNVEVAGPDPARQHLLAQEEALFSSQSTPETNLGFSLLAHNAYEAGKPLAKVRTGQQAETYVEGREAGEIPLGKKTGVYAKHLDPTLESPITGANDIWHARALGYVTREGKPWDAALTPQQHAWMDAETMLAVDRANARNLGGRNDWTAGEIQAAPWVKRKAEGLMRTFGWPEQQAKAEAIKSYNEFFQKHTAYGTYEATPGMGVGHLPDLPLAPYAEREAFAKDPRSSWTTPEGRDVIYDALGMYQRPTLDATGVFKSAAGEQEINPAKAARPLVGFTGPTGSREIDPQSRAMLKGAEALRAYFDAQNMGAFSMPIHGQQMAQSRALEIPTKGPLTLEQINALQTAGGKAGLPNVIDYGDRAALTTFGDKPSVAQLGKNVRGQVGEEISRAVGPETGPVAPPTCVKLDIGSIDYEKVLGTGQEGTRKATRILMQAIRSKDAPAMFGKLDADPTIRARVLARFDRDAEYAAKSGQPVRKDIQLARDIVSREGVSGLYRAMRAGAPLPAVALLPLASLLQEQQQSDE